MANLKISQLNETLSADTTDVLAIVNNDETKKITFENFYEDIPTLNSTRKSNTFLSPTVITGSSGSNHYISGMSETALIRLTFTGANGTANLFLPDATTNTNRCIRIIGDGTLDNQHGFDLTPSFGQDLDGSTGSYNIGSNKSYDGVMVWTDGVEWFRIQSKG